MMERRRYFLRWDIHQRLQHALLLITFITLMVTGLPLRFATAPAARIVTQAVGGATLSSIIHRYAAILLILTSVYHLVYLGVLYARGRRRTTMIPTLKDVKDLIQSIMYNLGLARERPKFGRYSFDEKFEYWAVVWGSIIMIATGALLWDPVLTAQYLPVVALRVGRVVHSAEALLALLAIVIWHLYHAHLRPDVFPMSGVWIDGLMSEEEMKKHHELEYERIMARQRQEDESTED